MNLNVPPALRRLVVVRAGDRCEYCQLPQVGQEATFHVDHVVPVVQGGPTAAENLALACVSCSLRKGSLQSAEDPDTGEVVSIFSPRGHVWPNHSLWQGVRLLGITPIGRATVAYLEAQPTSNLGHSGRRGRVRASSFVLRIREVDGDRQGSYALTLSGRCRLILTVEDDTAIIEEVTNHYGD